MKKILLLALSVFVFTACSHVGTGEMGRQEARVSIAVVSDDDGFEKSFAEGAELASEDFGFDLRFYEDYDDIRKDSQALVVQREDEFYVSYQGNSFEVSPDYKAGGEEAAKRLGDKVKSGKVLFAYEDVIPEDYKGGFVQKAEELQLDYEIIQANDDFEYILPDVTAVVCCDEDSAEEILEDIAESKLEGKVWVIGYDSGREQKKAVERGIFLGAVTRKPAELGYNAAKAAYDLCMGSEPDAALSGMLWYDRDNIKNEEIQACLYE